MRFKIDCEHIFFDRYDMKSDEKKNEAEKLIKAVLKGCRITEDGFVEVNACSAEEEFVLEKGLDILKKEFFIVFGEEEKIVQVPLDSIDEVRKYIDFYILNEELTPAAACEAAGVTRKAADNEFLKRYQMTIKEYIKQKRVKKAAEVLKSGCRAEECAALCGFGSLRTMQRAVKEVCGMTVGQMRGDLDSEDGQ